MTVIVYTIAFSLCKQAYSGMVHFDSYYCVNYSFMAISDNYNVIVIIDIATDRLVIVMVRLLE